MPIASFHVVLAHARLDAVCGCSDVGNALDEVECGQQQEFLGVVPRPQQLLLAEVTVHEPKQVTFRVGAEPRIICSTRSGGTPSVNLIVAFSVTALSMRRSLRLLMPALAAAKAGLEVLLADVHIQACRSVIREPDKEPTSY